MESTVSERLDMYKAAIANAKQTGESSKVRRYERGLKTLEGMLVSVKNGKTVDEDDLPPPVAVGKSGPDDRLLQTLPRVPPPPEKTPVQSPQEHTSDSLPAEPLVHVNVPPPVFPKPNLPPPIPAKVSGTAVPPPVLPRLSSANTGTILEGDWNGNNNAN